MPGNTLDLLLVAAVLFAGVAGYRRGFVLGIFSFIGFTVGGFIGLWLSPWVISQVQPPAAKLVIGLGFVLALALGAQVGTFLLGVRVRKKLQSRSAQLTDGVSGSVMSVLGVLVLAWMVAVPTAAGPSTWWSSQVRQSAVITAIDHVMPGQVRGVTDTFAQALRSSEFPDIFDGLTPTHVPSVDPPDPELQHSPIVEKAHNSVVKVTGQAAACNRSSEGTGFVYAPRRVMTNAHVVAGSGHITVELYGDNFKARVVFYDPQRDIAVLHVPDLYAPSLSFVDSATSGDDAIVVGYPLDGPYTAAAARIRERTVITGPNIYHTDTVDREVYSVRGNIRPGNSGGPLLSPTGDVYGLIFAAAADDPETGYALTAQEVAEAAAEGTATTREVSTKKCD